MKYINCTPHTINVFAPENGEQIMAVDPSGAVARVEVQPIYCSIDDATGIVYFTQNIGEIINLPEPEDDTMYIVSAQVRLALPGRLDLASPGEEIRNEAGQPIGCIGLYVNG